MGIGGGKYKTERHIGRSNNKKKKIALLYGYVPDKFKSRKP